MADRLVVMTDDPYRGAVKLEGVDGYRVRVGDYRILFHVIEQTKTVLVWRIGHRREVYRDL